MFTFGYLFSRMSWSNICFHRYFSQYLSLYEVFNVHSLRKAKPLEVSSKLLYQSTFISNAFGSGQLHSFMFLTEWRWRDSNSWPPACKAGALPTELHPHLDFYSIQRLSPMGLSGLEPPTSRLSGVRSNRLSYKPRLIMQKLSCHILTFIFFSENSPHCKILYKSGSHLLSHTVSSIVSSAVWVLTIVFGMCTGVSPKRIATRINNSTVK